MDNLIKEYSFLRLTMGSGSVDWVDLKTDYIFYDDMLVGTIADFGNKNLIKDKVIDYKADLNRFRDRVNNYQPKDVVEVEEKEILEKKIGLAEKIADLALIH